VVNVRRPSEHRIFSEMCVFREGASTSQFGSQVFANRVQHCPIYSLGVMSVVVLTQRFPKLTTINMLDIAVLTVYLYTNSYINLPIRQTCVQIHFQLPSTSVPWSSICYAAFRVSLPLAVSV